VTLTFDLDIQIRPREGPNIFHVNLAQIRSVVPEIFHTQKSQRQKQNLMQFTACGNYSMQLWMENNTNDQQQSLSARWYVSTRLFQWHGGQRDALMTRCWPCLECAHSTCKKKQSHLHCMRAETGGQLHQ